jgi:transposase InsO family protein
MRPDQKSVARLRVLNRAEALGNVTQACREYGMDRTSYYRLKRRYDQEGLQGLCDHPPVHKSHPETTPAETVQQIYEFGLTHPRSSARQIMSLLAQKGIKISAVTVGKVLKKRGLVTSQQRWMALEQHVAERKIDLSEDQLRFIEKFNPCFRERAHATTAPGEVLIQDTVAVPNVERIGDVFLSVAVDAYSSIAFARIIRQPLRGRRGYSPAEIVTKQVLPFFGQQGLRILKFVTDYGREFSCDALFEYDTCLRVKKITHLRKDLRRWPLTGFYRRFRQVFLLEFIDGHARGSTYESLDLFKADLDRWLDFYNRTRLHWGYPNYGAPPAEMIRQYVERRQACLDTALDALQKSGD